MKHFILALLVVSIDAQVSGNLKLSGTIKVSKDAAAIPTISVLSYGAVGDGTTDNYVALQAAAAAICALPGYRLLFPPGDYFINRKRIDATGPGSGPANGITNIRYDNCDNVTISGYGATVSVLGAFNRPVDETDGVNSLSYTNAVAPFEFRYSTGFRLEGFTLNGNVQDMTRSATVTEGNTAGVMTQDCHDYYIVDVESHHNETDGFTIGGNSLVVDTNMTMTRVYAHHNSRQGLSVIHLVTGLVSDSRFEDTGYSSGSYGYSPPGAGVDVEPFRKPPEENALSTGLVFDGVTCRNNRGQQFINSWPEFQDTVVFQNGSISAPDRSDNEAALFINASKNATTTGTLFTVRSGNAVSLSTIMVMESFITSITFSGNTFALSARTGIYPPERTSPVAFTANTVSSVSSSGSVVFARMNSVTNNIFIDPIGSGNVTFTSISGATTGNLYNQ